MPLSQFSSSAFLQDPFGLKGVKLGPWGTKAAPRPIPSHFDARFVGCVCKFPVDTESRWRLAFLVSLTSLYWFYRSLL